jgi:predicted aconitase
MTGVNLTTFLRAFRRDKKNIASSYERMGAAPSFTCIPYEVFDVPKEAQSLAL